MKYIKSKLLVMVVLILSLVACNNSSSGVSNIKNAEAVLQAIQSGDVTAMQDFINQTTYTQHNLSYPDGVAAVIGATESGAFAGTTIETIRSFADADTVVLHSKYGGTWNGGVPQDVFDVFRFENGLIVEHWDNLANVEDDDDGTTQFDGALTPATDISKTVANRVLIEEVAKNFFLGGEYARLAEYFNVNDYVQHSVGFSTDIVPLQNFLSTLAEGTPFYSSVEFIHVEGNFALMMSQGFPDATSGLSSAYYDLFRLENGKIVEHWDIVQEIPPRANWQNDNGKW